MYETDDMYKPLRLHLLYFQAVGGVELAVAEDVEVAAKDKFTILACIIYH